MAQHSKSIQIYLKHLLTLNKDSECLVLLSSFIIITQIFYAYIKARPLQAAAWRELDPIHTVDSLTEFLQTAAWAFNQSVIANWYLHFNRFV